MSSKDIFQQTISIGQPIKIAEAVLEIEGGSAIIATGIQVSYQRAVNIITPINSASRHVFTGRGSGTFSLSAIVGTNNAVKKFLETYTNECNVKSNVIQLKPSGVELCDDATNEKINYLVLHGPLINGTNFGVQQIDGASMLNTSLTGIIMGLEFK